MLAVGLTAAAIVGTVVAVVMVMGMFMVMGMLVVVGDTQGVHFLVGHSMVVAVCANGMVMIEMHKNAPLLFSIL